MNINKYRDLCRKLIYECRDRELTRARKNVLLALVDCVNDREGYSAWPAFDSLADKVGADRRTAIRAINVGRKIGLLQRIYKGGQTCRGGTSNRYRFCIDPVSGVTLGQHVPDMSGDNDLVSGQTPTQCQTSAQPSVRPDTQSSNDHLNDHLILKAPPSPSFGNDAVVAKEEKKGVGEEGSDLQAWTTPSLEEIPYTPELRKLYERAEEEVYTPGPVPQRHWCKRKQTREEFDAEMAARGINMDASRRRLGATAQW
jgi:hypothetical protein